MTYPLMRSCSSWAARDREDVRDNPQRGARRIDVGAARDVFFQDVVLDGARQRLRIGALFARDGDVEREQDDGGRVDRHRSGNGGEGDPGEQLVHIDERVNRDPDAAHLTTRQFVVGVVPHLGGQVEGDAQAGDPLPQQVVIALVGCGGSAEAGILAHGPQAAPIHRRLDAARKREHPGELVH
jgi:hypothetical protein